MGYTDNQWLQAVIQGGAVGVLAMVMLSVGSAFGMAAALRSAASQQQREQAYTLGAMSIGIWASSFTFDLLGYEQATALTFIVFALMWSGFDLPVLAPYRRRGDPADAFL
jgi:O-antigen ligase